MNNSQALITVKNLKKTFPQNIHAIKGIDFEVYDNEIFGLLGANGSGKSTTLRILATVLEPTSGHINFRDLDHDHKRIRYEIGYIPQQDLLFSDLTVLDNVRLFADSYNFSYAARARVINEMFERMELNDYRNRQVGDLSGGYKKRLSIAIALLHKPKVIIADEITIGLDPDLRQKIWDLLLELKKEATIIFTTHYLEEAEFLCDRIALMNLGEIVAYGNPQTIINETKSKDLNDVFYKLITHKAEDEATN
jgi:ABC-2 type transport system ATP-binding protein